MTAASGSAARVNVTVHLMTFDGSRMRVERPSNRSRIVVVTTAIPTLFVISETCLLSILECEFLE